MKLSCFINEYEYYKRLDIDKLESNGFEIYPKSFFYGIKILKNILFYE